MNVSQIVLLLCLSGKSILAAGKNNARESRVVARTRKIRNLLIFLFFPANKIKVFCKNCPQKNAVCGKIDQEKCVVVKVQVFSNVPVIIYAYLHVAITGLLGKMLLLLNISLELSASSIPGIETQRRRSCQILKGTVL